MLLRSLLFVPANRDRFVAKAATLRPDAVIVDLEDSVPPAEKVGARARLPETLTALPRDVYRILVRVNSLDSQWGRDDVRACAELPIDAVLLPKVMRVEELREANMLLAQGEARTGLEVGSVRLIAVLETVQGVLNAVEMAGANRRISAVAFGAEDYTLQVGGVRTAEGLEVLYARSRVVAAARAAGVEAVDTPWTDTRDREGLENDVRFARQLGFSGKQCIHPDQIEVINQAFTPTEEEVEQARRVIEAAVDGERRGHGTVALDGRMLDAPIVGRARRVLDLAEALQSTQTERQP